MSYAFLFVCLFLEGVIITSYRDHATGTMEENEAGGGSFTQVTLHPQFTVADSSMIERAIALHHKAHEICYIANSVNFTVDCEPEVLI